LSAGLLRQVSSWLGIVDRKGEERLAQDQVEALKIKVGGLALPVSSLSGGNQQKVLLARGLLHRPRVLILDEPTRGIDVGTKAEIHRLIMDLAREGVAVLLISSDLPEMLALADRVAVMHEGELMASLDREEATEEAVLRLAIGLGEGTGTEG
jgi:ribose transport system ATP-binding protein